ncbi:DUF924 family protein [Altericroceibacterium xinjiangense]|uniref:DUF924 family protein n=1 Tax=Altericroceibacterium xinjiangense TaxID=762261 RepID=UPI000F7EFCB6|nr:DUF924 family protein [Altericroceibacterium xinjiangense]
MAAPLRRWAAELLYHWFHRLGPGDWFSVNGAVDAELRRRFEPDLRMLRTCKAEDFLTDPQTALAAVLLFDQIPRNLYRDTPQAFAYDPLARRITRAALDKGWDTALSPHQRQFLGMPLMHSERIADQLRSLEYFARLGPRYGWPFARAHYGMIARFGRFPHRNATLGRQSTEAEERAVAAGYAW